MRCRVEHWLQGLEEAHSGQCRVAGRLIKAPRWSVTSVPTGFDHGHARPGLPQPIGGDPGQGRSNSLALGAGIDSDHVYLAQVLLAVKPGCHESDGPLAAVFRDPHPLGGVGEHIAHVRGLTSSPIAPKLSNNFGPSACSRASNTGSHARNESSTTVSSSEGRYSRSVAISSNSRTAWRDFGVRVWRRIALPDTCLRSRTAPACELPPRCLPYGPRQLLRCRGTGKVISNLGGSAHEVTCPWCGGDGVFHPGRDAQNDTTPPTPPLNRPRRGRISIGDAGNFWTVRPVTVNSLVGAVDTWLARVTRCQGQTIREDGTQSYEPPGERRESGCHQGLRAVVATVGYGTERDLAWRPNQPIPRRIHAL